MDFKILQLRIRQTIKIQRNRIHRFWEMESISFKEFLLIWDMNLPDVITKTAIKNNFLIAHKGIINRIIFKINCSVAV